jgi:hypothetical protein
MKDKGFKQYKNGSKGKNPGQAKKKIPPRACMSVSFECCVLSRRGLCDVLVLRPEESYRLWCVSNVCDHKTSTKRGGPDPYRAVEP